MTISKDAYRQVQEELAALDKDQVQRRQRATESPMDSARREFLALRDRYALSVADVIAFFPEEEGVTYLQGLIAAAEAAPPGTRKRRTKRRADESEG